MDLSTSSVSIRANLVRLVGFFAIYIYYSVGVGLSGTPPSKFFILSVVYLPLAFSFLALIFVILNFISKEKKLKITYANKIYLIVTRVYFVLLVIAFLIGIIQSLV